MTTAKSTPASVEAAARAAAREEYPGGGLSPAGAMLRQGFREGYLAGHAAAQAELERANALLIRVPYYIGIADSVLPKGTSGRGLADELFAAIQAHLAGQGEGRAGARGGAVTDAMVCDMCGLDYTEPSMSGDGVCPWCDVGVTRDGRKWTYREAIAHGDARIRRVVERLERTLGKGRKL